MSLLWRGVGLWLVAVGGTGLFRPRFIIQYQMERQAGVTTPDPDDLDVRRVRITQVVGALVLFVGLALAVTGSVPGT